MNFKNGDKVLASNDKFEWHEVIYVFQHSRNHYCEDRFDPTAELDSYTFVKPIPKITFAIGDIMKVTDGNMTNDYMIIGINNMPKVITLLSIDDNMLCMSRTNVGNVNEITMEEISAFLNGFTLSMKSDDKSIFKILEKNNEKI